MIIPFKKEFLIKEWSDEAQKEKVVASFALDDGAYLKMLTTELYAKTLIRNGLAPEAAEQGVYQFRIHLEETPPEVLCIALGLPGNDPEFRARHLSSASGSFLSTSRVLNMAIEGHPQQSGRVVIADQEVRDVAIDVARLVDLDGPMKEVPVLPGVLGASHPGPDDLVIQNVLAIKGRHIVPGYVVTGRAGGNTQNLTDRLAVMTAFLEESAKIHGAAADRIMKVGVLEDGRPYTVFRDQSRNVALAKEIKPSPRDPARMVAVLDSSALYARRRLEGSADLAMGPKQLEALFKVGALAQMVEDKLGFMPRPVRTINRVGLHVSLPKVPDLMALETMQLSKREFAEHGPKALEAFKGVHGLHIEDDATVLSSVSSSFDAVAALAQEMKRELETRLEAFARGRQGPRRMNDPDGPAPGF